MAQWHFWDENGYKIGPVRGRDLKRFAQEGMITPETRVEDENGRTALAKNVTGLSFHSSVLPESSTVVIPPSAVKPFVAPVQAIPQSVPVPVVEESEKSSRLITVIGIIAVAVIGVIGWRQLWQHLPPSK